jgi:hypothetical protein
MYQSLCGLIRPLLEFKVPPLFVRICPPNVTETCGLIPYYGIPMTCER